MNDSLVNVFPKEFEEVITLTITSIFIIIVALAPANILVLFGYLTSRSTRTKPSSILLVSMTIDSVVVVPSQLVEIVKPELAANGGAFCTFVFSVFCPLYVTMEEILTYMSVDRYLAIKSMLRYSRIMTKNVWLVLLCLHGYKQSSLVQPLVGPFLIRFHYIYRFGGCGIAFGDRVVMLTFIAIVYCVIPPEGRITRKIVYEIFVISKSQGFFEIFLGFLRDFWGFFDEFLKDF